MALVLEGLGHERSRSLSRVALPASFSRGQGRSLLASRLGRSPRNMMQILGRAILSGFRLTLIARAPKLAGVADQILCSFDPRESKRDYSKPGDNIPIGILP